MNIAYAYVIGHITVNDAEKWTEYRSQVPATLKTMGGRNSVPLDDRIADLVFMITLHHELDNPSLTVEEPYRILKPGGEIFIVDWKKIDMDEGPPEKIRCAPE
ncbi:MAG: methyltransferase domain-containing protein, partial [Desulfobacterales bacterium]